MDRRSPRVLRVVRPSRSAWPESEVDSVSTVESEPSRSGFGVKSGPRRGGVGAPRDASCAHTPQLATEGGGSGGRGLRLQDERPGLVAVLVRGAAGPLLPAHGLRQGRRRAPRAPAHGPRRQLHLERLAYRLGVRHRAAQRSPGSGGESESRGVSRDFSRLSTNASGYRYIMFHVA